MIKAESDPLGSIRPKYVVAHPEAPKAEAESAVIQQLESFAEIIGGR